MTQIELIKQEIERLENRCVTAETFAEELLSFIESLEQEPIVMHTPRYAPPEREPSPTIKGWVARDDDNTLCVFSMKPERVFSDALSRHYWHPTLGRMPIKRWFFFGLKPEDEPIEVELVIRKV